MKITNKIFYIFLSIAVCIFLWIGINWWLFLKLPLIGSSQKPVSIVVVQGMPVKKIALILEMQHLIERPSFFVILTRIKGVEHSLKSGEYLIEPGITTPITLINKMKHGEVIRHAFTIVEGWNFNQTIKALNDNPYVVHTTKGSTYDKIMDKIGHFGELPEGRFAPDTYLFSGLVTDTDILTSAYKLMHKRLQNAWEKRDVNTPYNCPYEALIVASLIEKETAFEQEKTEISGVIVRRINQNKLLQIDAAVIYGLGDKYKGKLNKMDYIKDTPYNTYTRKGLPPTPIAMAGPSSIEAALHPKAGTSMYYVSKGDGTHKFSNTFKEHDKAVKKYLKH